MISEPISQILYFIIRNLFEQQDKETVINVDHFLNILLSRQQCKETLIDYLFKEYMLKMYIRPNHINGSSINVGQTLNIILQQFNDPRTRKYQKNLQKSSKQHFQILCETLITRVEIQNKDL